MTSLTEAGEYSELGRRKDEDQTKLNAQGANLENRAELNADDDRSRRNAPLNSKDALNAIQGENFLSPVERAAAFRDRKLAIERSRRGATGPSTFGTKASTPTRAVPSSSSPRKEQSRGATAKSGSDRFADSAQASLASVVSSVVENCTLFFFHSNEYLLFLAPPRGFATVAAWTAASRATFEILYSTPNQQETTAKVLSWSWTVLLAISLALVLVDLMLYLLRRKKLITRLTEARAIRLLLLATFWLVVVRNALSSVDYWICSGRLSFAAREECLYHLDSRNHYALLFPFLATFPFWHNFACLLILVATEFIAGSVYMGQPSEVRLARYIFVFALCAAFLALYWWREVEARRRYSLVRRLAAVEAGKKLKMESLARTLLSLAAPDQVHALLQGRALRIESPRCTILVTEIDQYLSFRQQMDPYSAVRLLEELVEDMETLRKSLRLQKLYFRGDVYITAIGLRERSGLNDHTPIILFASKYPAKALRVSRMFIHPIRARFGFGTGAGACVIYGGKTLAKGFCGEAFDDAKRHAKLVDANVMEVSEKTLEACPNLSATRTPSVRNPGFTILSRVREISATLVPTSPTAISCGFPAAPSPRLLELAGANVTPSATLQDRSIVVPPSSPTDGSGVTVMKLSSPGDVTTGPPTQPTQFSQASPTGASNSEPTQQQSLPTQLEAQPPNTFRSRASPPLPPLQEFSPNGAVQITVEEVRLPGGRNDAFSSDSSDSESDSGTGDGSGEPGRRAGLSESGVVDPVSDTNLLAESALLFPAADRQTAATRRAIEKQTTLFAVLFKEFRYRSVAEESKWRSWMVSFGEQSADKSTPPNPLQKSVSTRGSSGDRGPGSSSVPTRSSFSNTAVISAVGGSTSLVGTSVVAAGSSLQAPQSSNDASRIELDAAEGNAMEDPLLHQCTQRHCSEAEEVERAFHDGLSATRFPFFRAAVMLTLLIGNVGTLAASCAYTPASVTLHIVTFAVICIGYLLGNRLLESEDQSLDHNLPAHSQQPTSKGDEVVTHSPPASPTNKVADPVGLNPFEPLPGRSPATKEDLQPVQGEGEAGSETKQPDPNPNGRLPVAPIASRPGPNYRGFKCTRLQHAYHQSGCDFVVVALLAIATLVSSRSLLQSSLDHSFTYLYIVAVLTGGLPMQTALVALFFLWAPLAVSSVDTAFSLDVGYGIREIAWIFVIFTFVGLIALNEGVSIRRSVQYLLAQRANTQLAIAFEKRHQEVLGKMMPQHFVAAVEKRIIAAGRGTAAETIHDVAVLRFSLRPITAVDLGHRQSASASSNSLSAQALAQQGQGRSWGAPENSREFFAIPTPGAGSRSDSTVVMASNESATAPRTVLDELERRIILIEQALVGLETAWFTFWDGDTGEVSGPLHKSQPNFRAMPAVSKALGRQWHEEQGNKAAVELIRFLTRLRKADLWPWKGLLHRRDGLAVVFGLERPTFVLTGAVTEVASEAFSEVVSEGEVVMTEAFLKQFPTELACKTFGRSDASLKPREEGAPSLSLEADAIGVQMSPGSSGSTSTRETVAHLQAIDPSARLRMEADGQTLLPERVTRKVATATATSQRIGADRRNETDSTNHDETLHLLQDFWNSLGLELGPLRTARVTKNGFLPVRTLRRKPE